MARSTKRTTTLVRVPSPCPACGVDIILVCTGEAEHARGCERHKRILANNARLRAKLDAAHQASQLKAEARAAARSERSQNMSTTQAIREAEADLSTKGVDELKQMMSDLKVEGRSKLTKRADMEKAIRKVQGAKAASKGKRAPKGESTPVAAVGDIKVGTKVQLVRSIDLGSREEGYNGVVEQGATGKVAELRRSGPGVQVVLSMDDKAYGSIYLGARNLALV